MHTGKLDEKGRLKLPSVFLKHFNEMGETTLFVTSLDRRIAQIYTIPSWQANEIVLATHKDNPTAAKNIAFTADELGADAEIDSAGRILFNTDLRKELELDGQVVHIRAVHAGRLDVMSEAIFQSQRLAARHNAAADLETMEKAGLR